MHSGFSCMLRAALLLLALLGGQARADNCTVSMSDVVFSSVNPIAGADVYASGSGTIQCNWTLLSATPPYLLLFPNATVCLNLGLGSNSTSTNPRTMGNGSNRLQFNLYSGSSYATAAIWGSPSVPATPTPLSFTLQQSLLTTPGVITQNFTVYGKIPAAALTGVPSAANGSTVYSSAFTPTMTYAFYNLIAPSCQVGSSVGFSFNASATVINDCTISVGALAFGSVSLLNADQRTSSTIGITCTNNDAYQIALNGGSVSNSVASRHMKSTTTAEVIGYQLSATLDGPLWGDGTAGTSMVTGTGTGSGQTLTLYARVPAQSTPSPGDYKDTVTATIYF